MSLDDKFEKEVEELSGNIARWMQDQRRIEVAKNSANAEDLERALNICKESVRRLGFKGEEPQIKGFCYRIYIFKEGYKDQGLRWRRT